VLTASDGIEALAIYAGHKEEVCAVLTDMMMPFMSGPMTIRGLQKINPGVKVIAVSGILSNDKIAELASLGINSFLTKPYTAAELLSALNKVINRE
jgi:hypothetical protein